MIRWTAPLIASLALVPAAQAAAPARVVLADCTRGEPRAATFEGRVSAIRGTARMQMRFTLQARTPDDAQWRAVKAPGLGTWLTSAAGVRRWIYDKRVEQLLAPASYRAVARFRWLDARGHILDRARAVSGQCTQPDPRPDLVVRNVLVLPGPDAASRRYVAVVANRGHAPAGPFSVAFSAAGTPLGTLTAGGLAPAEVAQFALAAPACSEGAEIAAEADPDAAVDEANETDDRATTACPSS